LDALSFLPFLLLAVEQLVFSSRFDELRPFPFEPGMYRGCFLGLFDFGSVGLDLLLQLAA